MADLVVESLLNLSFVLRAGLYTSSVGPSYVSSFIFYLIHFSLWDSMKRFLSFSSCPYQSLLDILFKKCLCSLYEQRISSFMTLSAFSCVSSLLSYFTIFSVSLLSLDILSALSSASIRYFSFYCLYLSKFSWS